VARYLSKYLSKEAAGDWLRAKAGQRVFYVPPWLGRAAGASMRLARLARIVWAANRGYVPMPRIEDEDREALAAFIRGRQLPGLPDVARRARVAPAGARGSRATQRLHETVECLCSMAHPLVPSTHNQNRVVGLRDHSVSR